MAGNRGRAVVRDWQEGSYRSYWKRCSAGRMTPRSSSLREIPSKAPGMRRLIECVLPPLKRGQKREEWHKRAQHIRSCLWHAAIGNRELPYEVVYRMVPELRDFALTGALESCFPIRRDGKQRGGKKERIKRQTTTGCFGSAWRCSRHTTFAKVSAPISLPVRKGTIIWQSNNALTQTILRPPIIAGA